MASFATLNVNGLREANKRSALLHWLSHLSLDFACLQECHVISSAECDCWFSSHGFLSVVSPGSVHSCGSVILYRPIYSLVKSWSDDGGRFVMAEFSRHDLVFRVVSLYAPNRNPDRDDFFSFVSSKIDPSVPTLLCGDFNAVFDRALDRRGGNVLDLSRESCGTLLSLFRDCAVLDIWRSLHPSTVAFSWLRPDGSSSSRIDLIGCPYPWVHLVRFCDLMPCPFSDHSAVVLSVPIPEPIPRGPGRWKLNVSILSDESFGVSVRSFWERWRARKSSFINVQTWWDVGKEKLKSIAVQFCSSRSKKRTLIRSLLVNLSQHLKSQIDLGRLSLLSVYESTLSKIASIDSVAAEGARIRSRIRWAEEGESSSSFFFRLEKRNGAQDWISAMQNQDGSLASSISDICDSWVTFYIDLFRSSPTDLDVQRRLLDQLSSILPDSEALRCEGHLTESEVHQALLGMAKGKAPGSDGLSAEFYVTFWDVLGPDLVEVLNASYASGLLPSSQREALISLIFKKGDRLLHKNWRPISLLNVDYKLCARTLAGRLLKVIHHVVAPDQTCGVPGRYIGENVALLRDVAHYANDLNIPVAILSLDQEKAFDRVDWHFLSSTLQKMGFGPSFIRWVELLYSDIRSSVIINGYASRSFKPSRGVRQGCPLSPLLYILTMEVLAVSIRANPAITGLRLRGSATPLPVLSLYADDTSAITTSDAATVAVFDTYALFEAGTGSKLNLDKCKGLWLGSWRGRSDAPVPIDWTSLKLKVLGIFIGNGCMDDANWRPRLDAVEKCLNSWRSRSLSYGGKALVANALALSRIWYVASLVHMPDWVLTELNSLIFKFFWGGKRDLVARNVVIHSREHGGFGVVSVSFKVHALLVQWIRRFVASPNRWVSLMTYWFFDRFGIGPLRVLSQPFAFSPNRLPPFYADLLLAWRALNGTDSPGGLVVRSPRDNIQLQALSFSCKSCYQLLLSINPCTPHCIEKFRPSFGCLDWSSTWKSLFFMPFDRQAIDLNWKIAHGVLYTAERLTSFGYDVPKACFCGYHLESLEHLFFSCPLAQSGIAFIQSLLVSAAPLAPTIDVRHALFGFNSDEFRVVPRVFCYLLNVCKFLVWGQRNDFRFRAEPPGAVKLLATLKSRLSFYLPLFAKRFVSDRRRRYFSRQWGAGGVIGSFHGSSFKVRL